MRLLVLAIIFSLMMTNAAFAASEEAAECDMDIEVELLAIQNKEKRALLSKNKSDLLVKEEKSIITDAERQEVMDEEKKKESSVDPSLSGWN